MTEREDRLGRALADGPGGAPAVAGLADRARYRARARRRTRSWVMVGAVVLAVVAAVVPLAVLGADPPRVVGTTEDGWKTVELSYDPVGGGSAEEVLVDVPEAWVRADGGACRSYVYAAPAEDCAESEGISLTPDGGLLDYEFGPGLHASTERDLFDRWSGHVDVGPVGGGADVGVSSPVEQTARRVLGSVRAPGEQVPDLAGSWSEWTQDGLTFDVPRGAGGDTVLVDAGQMLSGPLLDDGEVAVDSRPASCGRWQSVGSLGATRLRVVAPTRALSEVVAASVRREDEEWQTVEVQGAVVDLPPGWAALGTTSCAPPMADPARTRLGPAGTAPCALAVAVDVFTRDAIAARGSLRIPGFASPPGLVLSGDTVVVARGDLETRRRVLASVRVAGEDPGDLSGSWVEIERDDATWQQPTPSDVEVTPLDADLRCRDVDRAVAAPTGDGRWRGTYCLDDRAATVTAPTQALADLVGSTVRSDVP